MLRRSFLCSPFFVHPATALNDDPVLIQRARHVITEIQRTHEAAEALKRSDFIKVRRET